MNGLRPPLTAPPGFAVRQSRSDSKECCRPALLFREGEFPWQTRKPIKNISSAGTTPLARLLSAVPDSVRPCRNYVELHIILLYFPAFCDTILILINFTAENSRWNINIFAKVFPAKSPQIHPTISEFAEWEWPRQIFKRPGALGNKELQGAFVLRKSMAIANGATVQRFFRQKSAFVIVKNGRMDNLHVERQ